MYVYLSYINYQQQCEELINIFFIRTILKNQLHIKKTKQNNA